MTGSWIDQVVGCRNGDNSGSREIGMTCMT